MTNSRGGRVSRAQVDFMDITGDNVEVAERPKPIGGLSTEERAEWVRICDAVPARYFAPATLNIVASYCRHVCIERRLAKLIHVCDASDINKYARLIRQLRSESTIVASLLRALRLTHLSNYAHDRTAVATEPPKPWLS